MAGDLGNGVQGGGAQQRLAQAGSGLLPAGEGAARQAVHFGAWAQAAQAAAWQ